MAPQSTRKPAIFQALPWLIAATVSTLAILAWGGGFDWRWRALNPYTFFPVLGLLGFSLMWTQYATAFLYERERVARYKVSLETYFRVTGYTILLVIVLHPGILVYQLMRDGLGLPPGSYERYLGPLAWLAMLGTVCLLIFLAYELRRWFGRRRWWKYVANLSDLAMLGIFYHALRLGDQLQGGWFRWIWWVYGLSLVVILADKYASPFIARARRTAAAER
jgi:hypothetical protein